MDKNEKTKIKNNNDSNGTHHYFKIETGNA